jgi:hypothetical protein
MRKRSKQVLGRSHSCDFGSGTSPKTAASTENATEAAPEWSDHIASPLFVVNDGESTVSGGRSIAAAGETGGGGAEASDPPGDVEV